MKFISLPSIRSTVAQLISNASLAFALATFTGVASSPAWAEVNLTLDQMYEKESDLLKDVEGMRDLLWWLESRTDPSKPAYGTKTYLEFRQKTLDPKFTFYSPKERQERIKEAAYIEEKYGRLSNNDLEIEYYMLAERACGNILSIAERGGKKALADVFLWGGSQSSICTRREIYLWKNYSFWEEFDLRMKAIAIQITEGKLQVESHVLAGAHFYLADLYSNKRSVIVRRGIDKTKYHLEQAKEAYDTGVVDGCRMYNGINDHYYRNYLARFDEKAEKK
ncbi:hypothetical protein QA338_07200 [Glaesserella parasuis]|uniref:hypothetical protein n=1 Tax=Glaesserella parasuis TaxID=738 RepID=UPI00243663D4|nr:hypothetical protein [Glaesserella parasuis]MDG6771811.1 hypothetical protein [Glaesserella parasuis]